MTLLDGPTIDSLRALGGSLLVQLVDAFGRNAPVRVEQTRAGLQSGDLDSVRRSCHSLKSTAATLGALTLSETARQIEAAAAAGDMTMLDQLGPALQVQYDLTIKELQQCVGLK